MPPDPFSFLSWDFALVMLFRFPDPLFSLIFGKLVFLLKLGSIVDAEGEAG
jgi:hypothetical protein